MYDIIKSHTCGDVAISVLLIVEWMVAGLGWVP